MQIEGLVGPEKKELFNGFIPAIGAFITLIVTPVAGILSDNTKSRWGKRKFYLVVLMSTDIST